MRIQPINNETNFGTKVKYNNAIEKGFELARGNKSGNTLKDLNFAKDFIDNVKTILNDGSKDCVEFVAKNSSDVYTRTEKGEQKFFEGTYSNEGYNVVQALKKYSEGKKNKKTSAIDELKSQLDGAIELVEILKVKYSEVIDNELDRLQQRIKNSK